MWHCSYCSCWFSWSSSQRFEIWHFLCCFIFFIDIFSNELYWLIVPSLWCFLLTGFETVTYMLQVEQIECFNSHLFMINDRHLMLLHVITVCHHWTNLFISYFTYIEILFSKLEAYYFNEPLVIIKVKRKGYKWNIIGNSVCVWFLFSKINFSFKETKKTYIHIFMFHHIQHNKRSLTLELRPQNRRRGLKNLQAVFMFWFLKLKPNKKLIVE